MITLSELTTGSSISLRDPDFSDAEDVASNTVVHTAMNGDIRTYRRTPALTKLRFTFTNLTRTKALELREFVLDTAGLEMYLNDHRQAVWRGNLLVEPLNIVTDGKGPGKDADRREANTVTLEFEGVKVS